MLSHRARRRLVVAAALGVSGYAVYCAWRDSERLRRAVRSTAAELQRCSEAALTRTTACVVAGAVRGVAAVRPQVRIQAANLMCAIVTVPQLQPPCPQGHCSRVGARAGRGDAGAAGAVAGGGAGEAGRPAHHQRWHGPRVPRRRGRRAAQVAIFQNSRVHVTTCTLQDVCRPAWLSQLISNIVLSAHRCASQCGGAVSALGSAEACGGSAARGGSASAYKRPSAGRAARQWTSAAS